MSTINRLVTGAALVAAVTATGTAPAFAETSATCVHSGSVRLFTANDGDYKVWIDQIRSSSGWEDFHLCYAVRDVLGGDIIVRYPIRGTIVPTIAPDLADDDCPRLIELQDPVPLMTRFAESLSGNPAYLCFGVADLAYRVTFTAPSPELGPRVTLDLDKGTPLTNAYCSATADPDCTNGSLPYVRVI